MLCQETHIFRRLKVLSSYQQQNQHFIRFKSEARKAENKSPSSLRLISQLHIRSFAGGFFLLLLLFCGSSSAFHPLLAFFFLFVLAAVQQVNSTETHPYTVKTQRLPSCATLSNKPLQSADTLRSLTSRGLNNLTLIETMTERWLHF